MCPRRLSVCPQEQQQPKLQQGRLASGGHQILTFRRWLCRDSGEAIEVLALPLAHADAFERDESIPKSAGLLFGLMWLRNQKRADTL